MRVAHVITRLIVGGAQENTIATVLGLQHRGVDTRLFSGFTTGPEGSLEPTIQSAGVLVHVPKLVRPVRPWTDCQALVHLRRLFLEYRPEIVHTHSGKAGILGRFAARQARVPVIIHTIHGPSFGHFQGAFPNWIYRAAERRAAHVTTHFIVVADAMKDQYLRAGIGHPEDYTRIWSGFPLDPFLDAAPTSGARAELGLAPSDIVLGKIARLFELKGHDNLFSIAPELLAQCPRLKFLLIGDGPHRQRFQSKVESLGLKQSFVFAGLVPPLRMPQMIASMDFLIHLSQREGLARALPQALATQRPIIAFDSDGAREVCLDGQTGFLVPQGNLSLLRDRILELAGNRDLRRRMGRTGQAFVRERFSEDRMVDDILHLYQRQLER